MHLATRILIAALALAFLLALLTVRFSAPQDPNHITFMVYGLMDPERHVIAGQVIPGGRWVWIVAEPDEKRQGHYRALYVTDVKPDHAQRVGPEFLEKTSYPRRFIDKNEDWVEVR